MNGDRNGEYGQFPKDFLGKKRRTTGQKVGIGCGALLVAAVALGGIGAMLGDPKADGDATDPTVANAIAEMPETKATADAAAKNVSATKPANASSDKADDVLLVIRQSFMPVAFCSGEIGNLRAAADKVVAGRGTPMDAYRAAHLAERDCQKVVAEAGDYERRPFKDVALNGIYERTLPACQKVSLDGVSAAKVAKELLDGEPTLKKGQQFRDLNTAMLNKATECKLGLQGLAERAGVPSDEVEFLKL